MTVMTGVELTVSGSVVPNFGLTLSSVKATAESGNAFGLATPLTLFATKFNVTSSKKCHISQPVTYLFYGRWTWALDK